MIWRILGFIIFLAAFVKCEQLYTLPEPVITAYHPKGFRISIEDSPGVHLFAVHANINDELPRLAAGRISVDVTVKKGNRWVYEDPDIRLNVGDRIYYWLYVIKYGLGYRKDDGEFTVTDLKSPYKDKHQDNEIPSVNKHCTVFSNNEDKNAPSKCEDFILNATTTIINLQSQLSTLTARNQQLTAIIEKLPKGRTLTMRGKVPLEDDPFLTVSLILREKLDLNPDITSAIRNSDDSITFEVSSINEKLEILNEAKAKLLTTRIIII